MRKIFVLLLAAAVGAAVCLFVRGERIIETEVVKSVPCEFKVVKGDEMMKFNQAQLYHLLASLTPSGSWRFELGGEASYVLDHPDATPLAKSYAAALIGRVGYAAAIPLLIKYIDLENPIELDTGGGYSFIRPCMGALADFKTAAVPALVEAYASETKKERRELINDAIVFCGAHSEARTYTLGTLAQTTDPAKRKALEELLKIIPEEKKSDGKQ